MNTEQPSRNQNYGPLCSLECGSLLPLFFVWSLFRVRQGASKLAHSKEEPKNVGHLPNLSLRPLRRKGLLL